MITAWQMWCDSPEAVSKLTSQCLLLGGGRQLALTMGYISFEKMPEGYGLSAG